MDKKEADHSGARILDRSRAKITVRREKIRARRAKKKNEWSGVSST